MTWTSWKPGRFLRSDKRNVHAAAREIALAIGVPPVLLGIPGDATYSNYQEANRAFYRQTVLPLVTRTARALTDWLGSVDARGGRLPAGEPPRATRVQTRDLASKRLVPDFDSVEALSPEREASCRRRASIEAGPPGKNILPHPRRKTRGHRL
jgi:phage portal protein BeeE